MHLLKVIAIGASATAATAAATTICVSLLLNASDTNSSANSYAKTPQESESLVADVEILSKSPDNNKSAVEQHSITTEPELSKVNNALPESIVPSKTSDNGTDALNINTAVNENQSAHTENGNTGDNDNPPAAEDNNPAKTITATDKADVSALSNNADSSSNTLGNTMDNSLASVVSDTDSSISLPTYDHTTSIYTNDMNTLLRVEYYDDNNHLFEYSFVTDYDKDTNSYTETVYRWDEEKEEEVTMRTDTYVNGELISSESP